MVDKFKHVLEKLVSKKGEVSLFAILKMDDLTEKWSVILAAPWISASNRDEVFAMVRSFMLKEFTDEEASTIARLGVFLLTDHIVQELLKFKEGTIINEDVKINGNIVHNAHILASNIN